MSVASTTIAYVGKKVEDGTMDVRDLGPALLAVGKLCEHAHKIVNKDSKGVSVLVKKISVGSFEIDLSVTASFMEQTKNIFGFSDYKSADYILNILGFGVEEFIKSFSESLGKSLGVAVGTGLPALTVLAYYKIIKKRKIISTTIEEGHVKVTVEGQKEPMIATRHVWDLYNNKKIQNNFYDIVSPLEQEGMDAFEVRDKKQKKTIERITKEEVPYFAGESKESVVEERERKVLLQVDTPHITDPEKRRWLFSSVGEGSRISISASIMDKKYMDRIKRGEISFKHGVRIRATVVTRHITQDNKERNEYELHDIEHDPQGLLQKKTFKEDKLS